MSNEEIMVFGALGAFCALFILSGYLKDRRKNRWKR